ncbi:hypothetical protein T265_13717, partial [Opisthorchis viverrini]
SVRPGSVTLKSVFKPRKLVYLAIFNVGTLKQSGQQVAIARTVVSLYIDNAGRKYCDRIDCPSLSSRFRLHTSGVAEAAAAGYAGVGIVLSERAEAPLLDWIPVDSCLRAVHLATSVGESRGSEVHRTLFIVSAYAPTDCSSESAKDSFFDALDALLQQAKSLDVVAVAGDMNAQVGRLSAAEARLGGCLGLDTRRTDNGDRLLQMLARDAQKKETTYFRCYEFPEQRKSLDNVVPTIKPAPNPDRPYRCQLSVMRAAHRLPPPLEHQRGLRPCTFEKNPSAVAPFRCLTALPPEGCTRAWILPGCPSLDRESREAEVGFEPWNFRSVNSRSYHLGHLAPFSGVRKTRTPRSAVKKLVVCKKAPLDLGVILFNMWYRRHKPPFDAYPNHDVRPGHKRDAFLATMFPLVRNGDMFTDVNNLGYDYDKPDMLSCHPVEARGLDTVSLPKPRQAKSKYKGSIRTTNLPARMFTCLCGQPGSIQALLLPPGVMAAGHWMIVAAERLFIIRPPHKILEAIRLMITYYRRHGPMLILVLILMAMG